MSSASEVMNNHTALIPGLATKRGKQCVKLLHRF